MSLVTEILKVSRTIDSPRTKHSIFDHLLSEVHELEMELGTVEGEDGIIGEAIDVILCAVDIIWKEHPDITEEEMTLVAERKLAKWQRLYGKGEKQ